MIGNRGYDINSDGIFESDSARASGYGTNELIRGESRPFHEENINDLTVI